MLVSGPLRICHQVVPDLQCRRAWYSSIGQVFSLENSAPFWPLCLSIFFEVLGNQLDRLEVASRDHRQTNRSWKRSKIILYLSLSISYFSTLFLSLCMFITQRMNKTRAKIIPWEVKENSRSSWQSFRSKGNFFMNFEEKWVKVRNNVFLFTTEYLFLTLSLAFYLFPYLCMSRFLSFSS